jgi:glycosyltransferase involved in cell wall biosynthesis
MQYRQALGAWKFATRQLEKKHYDVIELYGAEFGIAARSVSQRASRPLLVAHTNGMELLAARSVLEYAPPKGMKDLLSHELMGRMARMYFTSTDRFVCMASPDLHFAVHDQGMYAPEHAAMVPHGVDQVYRERPFIEDKDHRVAYCGSWIPRKGTDILARVMAKLLKDDAALTLDLIGSGEAPQKVKEWFPEELHGRIVVYPRISPEEIALALSRAKVFFFPSRYEGFGLAVTEAMCCSCAVVGSPAGVLSDLVPDREAIVCDYRDEDGMARAVAGLLGDEENRRAIAYRGWLRAREMSWEVAIDSLDSWYRKWIAEGAVSP